MKKLNRNTDQIAYIIKVIFLVLCVALTIHCCLVEEIQFQLITATAAIITYVDLRISGLES